MNYKALFKTAMLAGEIMAQSGAETYRVEDTMIRILKTSNLASVEIYATTTGIVATLSDPSIEPITGVKRIINRSNNLSRINDVNQISRNICEGIISVEEACVKLEEIRNHKAYSNMVLAIATVVSMGGFVGIFGGTWLDCILAGVNGLFIVIIGRLVDNRIGSAFIIDMLKCFVLAFITMIFAKYITGINRNLIIIGSIMPFVPGIPITNAIRDTLQGDYNSGTARAVEAFVISLGIAVGVGLGIGFFNFVGRMI
ncbi:MAG: hypothetical protein K0R46_285 [Herbinix sp.]|jgi:uncharacterized membrane protein YjjP (DUF1212 family)|nr:hypothetical protein [Herbinix sp.]